MARTPDLKATIRELKKEINDVLYERINKGAPTITSWLTVEIAKRHECDGIDAFWSSLALDRISQEVERCVRELKQDGETQNEQLTFPGWIYLQKAYSFTRNGASGSYPIQTMTEVEIIAKVQEHRQMGRGHYAHAKELLRYLRDRRAGKVA